MALFNECMQECAQKVFDTADIVRDGDLSPVSGRSRTSENLEHKKATSRKAASYSCFERFHSITGSR
jgi:hypothetical protein